MDSYDILVILLSVALIISLTVWIFAGVLFVKMMKKLNHVGDSAQNIVDNIEDFSDSLKNAGKAASFTKAVSQIAKAFKGKGDEK